MGNKKENLKVNAMKKAIEKCLGTSFVDMRDFFEGIINGNYDMVIFISRRCYVLFQMFALVEKWSFNNVCTDLGIYANREKLKLSNNVIVVDDIVYTGRSIKNVLERVHGYVGKQCRIHAALYAANKGCVNELLKVRTSRANIKWRFQLTERQCQEMSVHFVEAILEAGMPYTTFVYPFWGRIIKDIDHIYDLSPSKNQTTIFKEYKWKTWYLNIEDKPELDWAKTISDYSCVRVYRNSKDEGTGYFLPFLFLKNIKANKVDDWYGCIADTFADMGKNDIAEEINTAIKEKEEWKKNAIEYIACIVSCFCSKALAEILDLPYCLKMEEGIEDSLKGSFSAAVWDMLKNCDRDFAENFFKGFSNRMGNAGNYFNINRRKNKWINILTQYVLTQCADFDVYETTYAIFNWLKSAESDEFFAKKQTVKALYLDDIVYTLREVKHYNLKDIYLAQIECWDMGIATYRFSYDAKKGICGICSAGEMSAAIPLLKYQEVIKEYFREKLKCDFWLENGEEENDILENIMQKAVEEKRYTKKEMDVFRNIVKERNGSLYGMLI